MALDLIRPLVYVTRDIERALGMEPGRRSPTDAGYFIVTNDTPYGRAIREIHPDHVILIESLRADGSPLDTYDLLALPEVGSALEATGGAKGAQGIDLLVFQNNARIERLAARKGWNLLNPSAELSKTVEEKISQVEWLAEDAALLPSHSIKTAEEIEWTGRRFVLQFNHAHTGQGTFVIDSEEQLADIKKMFPRRECRVTDFIDGPIFTVNAVVTGAPKDATVVGNPSYQITGLRPFTDLPFSTIGNDWALPNEKRYARMNADIAAIARTVGSRLKRSGWKGLFGIDVVFDERANKTFLLEINARQPASTTFESMLQREATKQSAATATIFEAHIMALLGEVSDVALPLVSGAQIVKRATAAAYTVDVDALEAKDLDVVSYRIPDELEEKNRNKELFRIRSTAGIIEAPEGSDPKLNPLGEFIRSCIRNI